MSAQQQSHSRPNILWLTLEDTSPRFGCYGDKVARTPNLDALANEGCVFPHGYSTAGVCAPSRAAVITGMHQNSIGAHHMRTAHHNRETPEMPTPYEAIPPHYARLLPEYLRAEGYFCTNNIKTDYQFNCPVTAWDEWHHEAHWRQRPDADQPFFAVFNFTFTHESGMWFGESRPEAHGPAPELRTNPDDVSVPPYLPDTPEVREAIARQYDNIERDDQRIGEVLAELKADGLDDNTLVIVWSDHGEGLPRCKRWPYDGGIHVPLIVRWPGQVQPGTVDERLVSMLDLGPTVLSAAGIDVPYHMQGRPFLGPDAQRRQYIYASRDRHDEAYDMVRAVRDQRYKYLRHYYPGKPYLPWIPYRNKHAATRALWRLRVEDKLEPPADFLFHRRPAEELYDTVNDPHEMHNLAKDPAHLETLQRMRQAMDDWQRDAPDLGHIDEAQMGATWRLMDHGNQPTTGMPVAVPITRDSFGAAPAHGGGEYEGPMLVQLHCPTQGASIIWTTEPGDDARWQLYTEPIRLDQPGRHLLRIKAQRVGFKPSRETAVEFRVK